ncbi:hypothetical protein, partial [Vibrio atlanticus]|uniref:hypothetical protein n=1 Tax=Vibrio atlanticus TaxID=693153 RepID=UPI00354BBBAC
NRLVITRVKLQVYEASGQKRFSKIANLAKHELLKVWKICLRDCPVSLKQIKLYYLGSLHILRNSK